MIVITGAAGFIGSALAWELNRRGNSDLLLVDDLGTGEKWKNLVPLRYSDYLEKDDFIQGVLESRFDSLGIKAIIHMGACSATTEKDASFLIRNNFEYSKKLVEWCDKNHVRLIYASSAATYGDGARGYSDDEAEIEGLRPLNMYGYSKQMFDIWLKQKGWLKNCVGLKYFNVFGPNEYHKEDMRSMVAKAYAQITDEGKIRLFKSHHPDYRDGEQMRDFIYIKDAVAMTLHFLETGVPGGLYNIGTGQARTWIDVAHALFAALGVKPKIEFIPMPEVLQGKYQYFTEADMRKFHSTGHKGTQFTLEAAVKDYAEYLKAGSQVLGFN